MLYGWFVEIFDDVTQNPYCKDIKKSSDEYFYVIKAMREAQSKFDSIEKIYDVQEYIMQIISEVKEHATMDELDGLHINDEIEKYVYENQLKSCKGKQISFVMFVLYVFVILFE